MLFRPEKGTFKKSKKSNFSKGVSPWSLSKNRAFYHLSIFAIQAREDRFLTFWIKKIMLPRPEKGSFKNDQEIEIFQRTVFVKKSNFLSSLFFGQIKPQKIFFKNIL